MYILHNVIALFISISNAFDCVDLDFLLKDGVRGTRNHLLKSYLKNRKQFIDFFGFQSNICRICKIRNSSWTCFRASFIYFICKSFKKLLIVFFRHLQIWIKSQSLVNRYLFNKTLNLPSFCIFKILKFVKINFCTFNLLNHSYS